ncbi:hypothetical protein GCM10010531_43550 [Blastococcus jejuensis]|uniref:ABC transport system permease protein n=2 Tax=Blastococcus jejuensis TaxID=351224 RepID=A0ABP6PP19_9ACTN
MRRPQRSLLRRLRIRLIPLPGQAIGLAVLVAVLAAALVSAPLMIASAERGAWDLEQQRLDGTQLGTTLSSSTIAGRQVSSDGRVVRVAEFDAAIAAAAAQAGLPEPVGYGLFRDPLLARSATGAAIAQVTYRTGAEEHLEIVAGAPSDTGVLVPTEFAAALGVAPGGTISLSGERGEPVLVPVSGTYTTPTLPMDPYWRSYGFLFLPTLGPTGDLVYPPAALVAPRDLALDVAAATFEDLFLEWFLPLDPGLPVAEARATVARVERLQAAMAAPESPVTALITDEGYPRPTPRTVLPGALADVDATVDLLSPPVTAVGVGGGLAALALVGAWAGHRTRRREDELRSLVARGLSPARAAGDAARESLLPVVAGLVAGGATGWFVVSRFGPSPDLPAGVATRSGIVLAIGGLAALAVVAAVTAVLVTRMDSVGRGQAAHLLGRIPWLPVTAALAVVATVPLVTGTPDPDGGGIDVLTLMVPLLITVVVAGAVTAALPWIGRRADARLRRLPTGVFLALRRVLAGQAAARLVVVTTALTLGLVVYAGALADSTNRTIAAKASVATGSDVVVPLPRVAVAPGGLPSTATIVGTEGDARIVPGDLDADLVAVRPGDIPGVVRWNDELAEQPLEELMAALTGYDGDRVPVLLAGSVSDTLLEGTGNELTVDFGYYAMPVEVVGRAVAFPGQSARQPLLVADWDRYTAALQAVGRDADLVLTREVWARGSVAEVLDALAAVGVDRPAEDDVETAADFATRPGLHAQTWSLGYLRAVALAAGVLGLVGVAMHAVSQQRRRTVSALLLRRMGMGRRAADATAGLEIGLLGGLAALVAVAVALPSSVLVLRLLDPVPSLQPGTLFDVPWASIAAVAGGVVLVTAVSALLVGRTARRATGGQVMRDAA